MTEEQLERRKAKQREYSRRRREAATPEDKAARAAYMKAYKTALFANDEAREAHNAKSNEYYHAHQPELRAKHTAYREKLAKTERAALWNRVLGTKLENSVET